MPITVIVEYIEILYCLLGCALPALEADEEAFDLLAVVGVVEGSSKILHLELSIYYSFYLLFIPAFADFQLLGGLFCDLQEDFGVVEEC